MKNLKIKVFLILGITIFLGIVFSNISNASSSSTYFYGEPISIEKGDDIEIISNEVVINTENSKIENKFLIKNVSDKEVSSKIFIKLEDSKIATSINNLKIKINKTEIKNADQENGKYVFDIKIPKGEGKKVEISYNTDNNLRNAKVLKYSLDNLKGQRLKYFKIDIMLPEVDVPLVNGIYPECYQFSNNTINVEYYDFNVNLLTKDFIIEKQTYKNLLYGQDVELNDVEKKIVQNAENWIKNGIVSDFNKYMNGEKAMWAINNEILEEKLEEEVELYDLKSEMKSIVYYSLAKSFSKSKIDVEFEFPYSVREDWKYPLTADYMEELLKEQCPLYGLTIAVDYIKSEGDKELYIYKKVSGDEENAKHEYVKTSEWDILKIKNRRMWYDYQDRRGLKTIHINQDITGAEIKATDEEKIEYVNMINPSLYARFTIYDGNVKGEEEYDIKLATGYYGQENISIAKRYNIGTNYDDEEYEIDSIYIDYDNDIVAKRCKVPNLAHNVGYRLKEDGKYIIEFFVSFYHADGYGNIKNAINCDRAKELKKENEERLSEIKKQVNDEISNIKINYDIQDEPKINDKADSNYVENNKIVQNLNSLSMKDILVYGTIGFGIIILIIVIIILLINRRKK